MRSTDRLAKAGPFKLIWLLPLVAVFIGCHRTTPAGPETPVLIGFAGPMTGPQANYGSMSLRGAELRFSEINSESPKNGGRYYRLLRGDDAATPSQAVVVAQDFASNRRMALVLGHFNSSCTLAAQRIYDQAELPNISYGSTNDDIGKGSTWTFRTPYKNSLQGLTLAHYAAAHALMHVAILADNEEYGRGLADVFKSAASGLNIRIVSEKSYNSDTTDYRPLFLSIQRTKPDAILLAGFYPQLSIAAVQAREVGIRATFLAGDGVGSSLDYIRNAGKAAEGTVATGPFLIESPSPKVMAFRLAFQKQYGQEPDSWAVYAYDAAGLADRVISQVGTDHEAIRRALAAINSRANAFPGLVGPIWFDANGDAVNEDVRLAIVSGGRYVVIPVREQVREADGHIQ